jgi:DNA polymerase-3 subunit delta'
LRIADFIGNGRLVSLLAQGTLPPSTLFVGPEGVGKRTLAILLAGRANCHHPLESDLCGECRSCQKVLRTVGPPEDREGNLPFSSIIQDHPDIVMVRPGFLDASKDKKRRKPPFSIGIDTIRFVDREAHYRPFESHQRFFIVDEAEKMTTEAANSLLKTLEEPPSTTSMILVTAYPQQLLPTIRSRCQCFTFLPLNRAEIISYLSERTLFENPQLRASFARGSIGSALNIDLEARLQERDEMLNVLDAWVAAPGLQAVFERCEIEPLRSKLRKKADCISYLAALLNLLYDVYYLQVETNERVISQDRLEPLTAISNRIKPNELRSLMSRILQAQLDVKQNVNPRMCFETLWLEIP